MCVWVLVCLCLCVINSVDYQRKWTHTHSLAHTIFKPSGLGAGGLELCIRFGFMHVFVNSRTPQDCLRKSCWWSCDGKNPHIRWNYLPTGFRVQLAHRIWGTKFTHSWAENTSSFRVLMCLCVCWQARWLNKVLLQPWHWIYHDLPITHTQHTPHHLPNYPKVCREAHYGFINTPFEMFSRSALDALLCSRTISLNASHRATSRKHVKVDAILISPAWMLENCTQVFAQQLIKCVCVCVSSCVSLALAAATTVAHMYAQSGASQLPTANLL